MEDEYNPVGKKKKCFFFSYFIFVRRNFFLKKGRSAPERSPHPPPTVSLILIDHEARSVMAWWCFMLFLSFSFMWFPAAVYPQKQQYAYGYAYPGPYAYGSQYGPYNYWKTTSQTIIQKGSSNWLWRPFFFLCSVLFLFYFCLYFQTSESTVFLIRTMRSLAEFVFCVCLICFHPSNFFTKKWNQIFVIISKSFNHVVF